MPLDLKSTINLPKTGFPMKASLPQNEPKMLARWEEMGIYQRIRDSRRGAPSYILHDGPPYANGPIHLGHALNKCLKDFIVKSKTMAGFDSPYVPGWDCHGLPIEIKVDQMLGGKKLEMHPMDVRLECRKYAQSFIDLQREQFKRLGVFGRFDRPYATMTPHFESVVVDTLYTFLEKGFVYKGLRSVYWCIHDQTALAEAEVEYENHTSTTVWVKYALAADPALLHPALAGKKVFTVIWTTTPWTLPASRAVAFHPEEEYVALDSGAEVFLVAEKLAGEFAAKVGLPQKTVLARFPGRKLEFTEFRHPFLDRNVLGVLAGYVTMDQGTGVVHTAPSHGADDFATGMKYKLDATTNVDEAGYIRNGLPEYDGQKVFQANAPIVDLLRRRGVLMHTERIEHSYPHCWRCHNPIIFRATEQWFISMETPMPRTVDEAAAAALGQEGAPTLRTRSLEEVQKVKWDPAWGEERMSNMLATRPDWCISRQRIWGVPIAVFLCKKCGKPVHNPEIHRSVVAFFAEKGADAWYTPEADALARGVACAHCGGSELARETDIIDVWFESGCSQGVVLGHDPELPWPSDIYLEGGDQFRGWFMSSLLCSLATRGAAPFRVIAVPGWTLDEQGRAMSKSLGNTVDPVDIAERLGGEIVRMWVASVDFRDDVTCSETLMQRVAENYRKLRNTFRYILGNLEGFDPQLEAVPFEKLDAIDQYMLRQTAQLGEQVERWYEEFAFHKIYQGVNHFCVVELSAFYFDVLKDRLYTSGAKSIARRSAQTAIWRIGEALVRLLAPIMTFTSEEVWQYLPTLPTRAATVHAARFPSMQDILGGVVQDEHAREQAADWAALRDVREQVLKALEEARNAKLIGTGLEAQVGIAAADPIYSVLERYREQLRYLFIVSAVHLERRETGNGAGAISVQVAKAEGNKCGRCWNYSPQVGDDAEYPDVCERCLPVIREIQAVR